jgi:hypothetical protein
MVGQKKSCHPSSQLFQAIGCPTSFCFPRLADWSLSRFRVTRVQNEKGRLPEEKQMKQTISQTVNRRMEEENQPGILALKIIRKRVR